MQGIGDLFHRCCLLVMSFTWADFLSGQQVLFDADLTPYEGVEDDDASSGGREEDGANIHQERSAASSSNGGAEDEERREGADAFHVRSLRQCNKTKEMISRVNRCRGTLQSALELLKQSSTKILAVTK